MNPEKQVARVRALRDNWRQQADEERNAAAVARTNGNPDEAVKGQTWAAAYKQLGEQLDAALSDDDDGQCAHCGAELNPALGYARVRGLRVCHPNTYGATDCYRRVTTYGEHLGERRLLGAFYADVLQLIRDYGDGDKIAEMAFEATLNQIASERFGLPEPGTPTSERPVGCGCDGDPIECSHQAARGYAEEKLRQALDRLALAEGRLARARDALAAEGYFTGGEIGADVAPRIIELVSELKDRTITARVDERTRLIELFTRAAAGRRAQKSPTGAPVPPHVAEVDEQLEMSAACYDSVIQLLRDPRMIMDIVPSWQWTEEETASLYTTEDTKTPIPPQEKR